MEIRHLRYFVAMAEAGSLMKASERLHVAQPALSVHLSNLEIELGVTLVRRSNKGIELTEEGDLLYERAKQMLAYHEEALDALRSRKTKAAGSVSLGLPSTMPALVAAPLYAAMREKLPDVSLYLVDASTAVLYEWLLDGKIDFAVLFSLPDTGGLKISPLYYEDFYLVGRPSAGETTDEIEFADLFDHPLIIPSRATSWRKILDAAAERAGRRLFSPIETESFSALKAAALSGQCYAIIPKTSVLDEIEAGTLHARKIVNPDICGSKVLVQLESRVLTAAQREVALLITKVVKQVMEPLAAEARTARGRLASMAPSSPFARLSGRRVIRKV